MRLGKIRLRPQRRPERPHRLRQLPAQPQRVAQVVQRPGAPRVGAKQLAQVPLRGMFLTQLVLHDPEVVERFHPAGPGPHRRLVFLVAEERHAAVVAPSDMHLAIAGSPADEHVHRQRGPAGPRTHLNVHALRRLTFKLPDTPGQLGHRNPETLRHRAGGRRHHHVTVGLCAH